MTKEEIWEGHQQSHYSSAGDTFIDAGLAERPSGEVWAWTLFKSAVAIRGNT